MIGGTLGWLVGIGALAVPGLGPLVAAGPIVAALAGAGAGGAVGGLTGAIVGFGIPEYEAKRYEGRVRKGGSCCRFTPTTATGPSAPSRVLERTGAQDIAAAGEVKGDFANGERPVQR